MAKNEVKISTVNDVKHVMPSADTFRRFQNMVRSMKSLSVPEMTKHSEQLYQERLMAEDHLIDAVDNKRCTNKALIAKAEKIKAERAKAEEKSAKTEKTE